MKPTSRLLVLSCMAVLLACSIACDDDDTTTQQVSSAQAQAALAQVLPATIEFSMDAHEMVELAQDTTIGGVCPTIPGAQSGSLCSTPSGGVVCRTNDTTSELQFDGCNAAGTSIDGTIGVSGPAEGPTSLHFDLDVGGRRLNGNMTITHGDCHTMTYQNMTLRETSLSTMLTGDLQDCAGVPGGNFSVTVNGSGFQPFVAVALAGGVATVQVRDTESSTPRFTCTWSPVTPDTATCVDFAG